MTYTTLQIILEELDSRIADSIDKIETELMTEITEDQEQTAEDIRDLLEEVRGIIND